MWGVVPAIYGWDGASLLGRRSWLERFRSLLRPRAHSAVSMARHPEKSRTVTVIVAARNYGRYLEECIRSIQANEPDQILYVDDRSDDDSVRVARKLGVEVIALRQHVGAASARNAGLDRAWGDYVVHVDGDDCLPTGYLAATKQALADSPHAPFAYTAAQGFGYHCPHWQVPARFDRGRLWRRNYVHTSAMYRREIIERAGRWTDVAGTCWDWSLALRTSRFGEPVGVPGTHILYRQHKDSWSHHVRRANGRCAEQLGKVRRECARKAIGLVYSGRLGVEFLRRWCRFVVASLADAGELGAWDLVVVDNSDDFGTLGRVNGLFGRSFRSLRVIHGTRISASSESERRDAVAKLLASQYTQVVQETAADLFWFLEDDVLVPANACRDLLDAVSNWTDEPRPAVAGVYRNRHHPERLVAHMREHGRIRSITQMPASPLPVDLTGTGCLMFWRDLCPKEFGSHFQQQIPAHDWHWCDALRSRGGRVTLIPDVRCQHFVTSVECV